MKSTVKIDYQVRQNGGVAVIKIVQPVEVLECSHEENDVDPRDKLVSQFLHQPLNVHPHTIFQRTTYYPTPIENPKHYVTNIEPISNEDFCFKIKHSIISYLDMLEVDFPKENINKLFYEIEESIKNK